MNYLSIKQSGILAKVDSNRHPLNNLRITIINETHKLVVLKDKLIHASQKDAILKACQECQNGISVFQSFIDTMKKKEMKFDCKSDAVVASNMLRILIYTNSNFVFCLVSEIQVCCY